MTAPYDTDLFGDAVPAKRGGKVIASDGQCSINACLNMARAHPWCVAWYGHGRDNLVSRWGTKAEAVEGAEKSRQALPGAVVRRVSPEDQVAMLGAHPQDGTRCGDPAVVREGRCPMAVRG